MMPKERRPVREDAEMQPRILFMGTPDIAVTCLDALVRDGHNVVGAVTRVDKPKGRHGVLTPPPVKVYAEEHGIPVHQPRTLRDDAFAAYLAETAPDLILVVAFGMILPKNVIDYPRFGCINVHASLLPRYRGAAPMQRAIMEGEDETGVTLMYMDEGLDTGDMIAVRRTPITPSDNLETIHDRLAEIGAQMLSEIVLPASRGELSRTKQDDAYATYAKKIERADCRLDFGMPALFVDCHIRGLSPMPLAYISLPDGKSLKVLSAHPTEGKGLPGEVLRVSESGDGELVIACAEGAIAITRVHPEGKRPMEVSAYLRGRKFTVGEVLA